MRKLVRDIEGFAIQLKKDNVGAFAAQAAFFILLSVIPCLLLLVTLIQYTPISQQEATQTLMTVVPEEFRSLVSGIISEIYQKSSATVPVSAVVTLWSAGRGINALTNGFNSVYQVDETRNYLLGRVRAAFYTLVFIVAIIASLVLMVFGNTIQKALVDYHPMLARVTSFILSMRTMLMILVLMGVFLFLYKFIPNRKASFRSQLPGAMISSVAWAIFSLGFSLYLDIFPGFSNMYGSLTTIVLVMLWMYFCMYIILIGAEINAYFEDKLRKLHEMASQRLRQEYQNLMEHWEDGEEEEAADQGVSDGESGTEVCGHGPEGGGKPQDMQP